jgi:hypothetical protein
MPQPNPIATALRAFLREHPEGVRERVLIIAFVELAGQSREDYDRVMRSFFNAGWIWRDADGLIKPNDSIL